MLCRNACPKSVLAAGTLIFCAAILPLQLDGQKTPKPLSKDDVIRLIKGDVPPNRVGEMARERGIDFELTPAVESELRQARATDELLATLRELAPKPPKPAPQPSSPLLVVESSPGGAHVYVDDQLAGTTSGEGRLRIGSLAAGEHRLRLSLEGYRDYEENVRLQEGQTLVLKTKMEPAKPPSPAAYPAEAAERERLQMLASQDPEKILRAFRTIYVNKVPKPWMTREMLESALEKQPEFTAWGLALVENRSSADVTVDVRVPWLTFNYIYSMTQQTSGILVLSGRAHAVSGIDGATAVAKNIMTDILRRARRQ